MAIEHVLTGIAALLLLSVLASKATDRWGVPSLLLFLGIGMLAGSEGPGGFNFDNAPLAQAMGTVALAFILFAGGLETDWGAIRPILGPGIALSTVGVLLTATVTALFAVPVLGFSPGEAFLLGAIVSSTDAAAVFSVLRSRKASLKGKLRPLLELESGSNDPMAVFLTVAVVELLAAGKPAGAWQAVDFVQQMAVGLLLGLGAGKALLAVANRIKLEYEGLYPVLTLGGVLLTYGVSASLGGNGFLAVYAAGITMGNNNFSHKRTVVRFHDGVAWLMQIALFLTLGLLVYPRALIAVAGAGLLMSVILIVAARPLAVFLTLLPFRLSPRENIMVSWVGLRGAVPIVLATFPLVAGLDKAPLIFNLVFFIVLTSVLVQGTSIPWVARLLKVDEPLALRQRPPLEFEPVEGTDVDLVDFLVPYGPGVAGKTLVQLGMPRDSLIVLINRDEKFAVPDGETVLEEGDVLMVLVNKDSLPKVRDILTGKVSESG